MTSQKERTSRRQPARILAEYVERTNKARAGRGEAIAVPFGEACRRLGFSLRTGQRLMAEGRFPILALQRTSPRGHWRFSTVDIDLHLCEGAVVAVRPGRDRSVR